MPFVARSKERRPLDGSIRPDAPKEAPVVSVGLLTFNRAEYLREAIQGVLSQTFTNFELLICDNASEDHTTEVVASFDDPRVRYLRHDTNIGPHRNFVGAQPYFRGQFAAMTSDDDILEPTLIERQIEVMQRYPRCSLVASNVSLIDECGRTIQPRLLQLEDDLHFEDGAYARRYLTDQLWLPTPSWLYRTKTVRRDDWSTTVSVGPLGDVFMLCGMNRHSELALIADPLVRYRQHVGQYQRQIDTTDAGIRFYRALKSMSRSNDDLRSILPRIEARLVSYEAEQLVTSAPGCRRPMAEISESIAGLDRHWQEAIPAAGRDIDEILRFEILKSLHELTPSKSNAATGESYDVNGLYRRWLTRLAAGSPGITSELKLEGVRSIAVMGSHLTAYLIALDAMRTGIEVSCFLDSSTLRHGEVIVDRPVESPGWLHDNGGKIDAVVVSSEKDGEGAIAAMLETHMVERVPVRSWKQLASGGIRQTA
jgi:hypothetical protein